VAIATGWTVQEALETSIERLTNKNVTEPDYSALYLMAEVLELPWERGIRDLTTSGGGGGVGGSHSNTKLTQEHASRLEEMLSRREDHEPIQYVLGKWDFLDYTVAIRKPLLCPRPETEELVLKVVDEATKSFTSTNTPEYPLRILDVGCGTGVIGISLADLLQESIVEAIDVEPIAIETSMENAKIILRRQEGGIDDQQHRYRAKLVPAVDYTPPNGVLLDLVVSNPPYIPAVDMEGLATDVVRHESETALCGGTDGMDVIRTILSKLPEWCKRDAVCWMEVDPSHPQQIEKLLSSNESALSGRDTQRVSDSDNEPAKVPGKTVVFESSHKDMFGKDRFVKLRVI
jgi:release factor glutamine methyltransferase